MEDGVNFTEPLASLLDDLRRAYPDGVPDDEYMALLAVLGKEISERNLGQVVAELVDSESVVVANDAAAALSTRRPGPAAEERVRSRLAGAGLVLDPEAQAQER